MESCSTVGEGGVGRQEVGDWDRLSLAAQAMKQEREEKVKKQPG